MTTELSCDNCTDPFTDSVYIECSECEPPTTTTNISDHPSTSTSKTKLRLCLDCFACGAELGDHKGWHKYYVKNIGTDLVLFPNDETRPWSMREELGLLDGIERYNLGNWEDISKHYVRSANGDDQTRTSRGMLDHYDKFYLHGQFGRVTMGNLKRPEDRDQTMPLSISIGSESMEDSKLTQTVMPSPPMKESIKKISSDDFRLLAYMPQRDDFEKEFNNDAESLISNLMILPDDDDLDKAVKVAQIEMYVREVAERRRRKLVAREYDLVSAFLKQEKSFISKVSYSYSVLEQKKMRMERELKEQMKKFAQFIPSAEFEQLIADIIKERTLKEQIKDLQDYRREGVTTLEGEKKFKGNESSTSKHQPDDDGRKESDFQATERRTSTAGIECVSGKSDWQRRTSDDERPHSSILSRPEEILCEEFNIPYQDYMLVKTCLLKEQAAKSQGLPLRMNIGGGGGNNSDDILEIKDVVKEFMKNCGWLPYFS